MPFFQRLEEQLRVWYQIRKMRRLAHVRSKPRVPNRPLKRVLILPCDPWTLLGSKGDEAMMLAVIEQLRRFSPGLEVGVITATPQATEVAASLGFVPLPAWSCPMADGIRQMDAFNADSMVVLGADVMDGYYSPVTTARMLMMADAAARAGVKVSLLGFSFNATPDRRLRRVFDGLSPMVAVNVRDQISLDRFRQFTRVRSALVSDSAFMLEPDASPGVVQQIGSWADERRRRGDIVLGFNMHPMLVRDATPAQITALVNSAVAALRTVCARNAVSLLLISHDYRGVDGDDVCLARIHDALSRELPSRLKYETEKFTAAQLKAIAGATDGVVTGRMHLAIAALGMQRPVAALTYQDKFQGLFGHFAYPERFLLSPASAVDPEQLAAMIQAFIDELAALRIRVEKFLPAVTRASALNIEPLLAQ